MKCQKIKKTAHHKFLELQVFSEGKSQKFSVYIHNKEKQQIHTFEKLVWHFAWKMTTIINQLSYFSVDRLIVSALE